jgi:hypothetical protein
MPTADSATGPENEDEAEATNVQNQNLLLCMEKFETS